ncbi:MAG: hypothetical protein ACMUIP_05960 [bacterium]
MQRTIGFSCPGEDTTYYVAAHAALRKPDGSGGYQTETGWADGDLFVERGMWGTYFAITLTCDCTGGGGGGAECETAFAYGADNATCFLGLDLDGDGTYDFNRWGWTNGPLLAPGSYTFDIYAGAGQCELGKGTLVGTLTVEYDGEIAFIGYWMKAGFTMKETHLYVGNEILARNVNDEYTVAPGQYPYIHEGLDGATVDVYGIEISGDIYIVAHAVVCGFEE